MSLSLLRAFGLLAWLAAGLVLNPFMSSAAHAQESGIGAAVYQPTPRIEQLDNGLTIITIPFESPGIVAYFTLVRVGSRDEVEEGFSGYAHLFEHMMFRGTERFPGEEYEALIQSFGADNNAYTTQDFTLYTLTAPSSVLEQVVEIEADRFQRLQYDDAAYRTETGAVRGEYNTHVSNPFLPMWENLSEMAFQRHTYQHTTLGYLRDIERMPEEVAYSRNFFRRFYTPDNCTVIVAGDVDHERLMTLARANYGSWRGRRHQSRIPQEPEPRAGGRRDVPWPSPTSPRMMIGYRIPGFMSGRNERARTQSLRTTAALQIIHGLAFSDSAPLSQRLLVEEQRLLNLSSWSNDYSQDPHLMVLSATLAEGQAFDGIIDEIQGALDAIGAGETSASRIEAVRNHIRYSLLTSLETPSDAAQLTAHMIAAGGRLEVLDQLLAALNEVTPEEIAQAARTYLTGTRRFVVTLAHQAEAEEDSDAPEGEAQ